MEQAKAILDLVVVKHEEGKTSEPEAGLKRRVLAYNEKLFIAEHEMVKGWTGTAHSHPHDQIVYVVHGHLKGYLRGENVRYSGRGHVCGARRSGTRRIRARRIVGYRCLHAMPRRLP